jgi:hypothetical protein
MAVIALFRDPSRPLPVREPLNGLSTDLPAESVETHLPIAIRQSALSLQRLEAGQ